MNNPHICYQCGILFEETTDLEFDNVFNNFCKTRDYNPPVKQCKYLSTRIEYKYVLQ